MQYTTVFAILAAAGSAVAAPVAAQAKNMMAADNTWTMQSFVRTCDAADDSCDYSFAVNTNDGSAATPCAYTVKGSPASTATYQNVQCGAFAIGSTHDAQGFQVLSVFSNGLIIYPGYTDAQLVNGQVVSPDQSYTPQAVPS